jgi:hypothetical protein
MFNKTRTIIITFVAALSVVSAAPMVSVTSAQRIPILLKSCPSNPAKGISVEAQSGTKVTVSATGKKYECDNGTWVEIAQEAGPEVPLRSKEALPPLPPIEDKPAPSKPKEVVSQEVVSPLPVAGGAAG